MKLFQVILSLMLCLLISGCWLFPKDEDHAVPVVNMEFDRAAEYQVFNVDSGGSESFELNLNLSETRNVFYVFTNPTMKNLKLPEVADPSKGMKSDKMAGPTKMISKTASNNTGSEIIKGSPWVSEWNEYLGKIPKKAFLKSGKSKSIGSMEPQFDVVNEPDQHLYDSEGNYLNATCRLIRTADTAYGEKTLNIWVADNCWEVGGNRAYNVTQDMVEAVADKFLNDNRTDDDIYDWVTNLYGEEWSSYNYEYLIPESDEITIFLYDIADDNNTTEGYLGMFHSKDNIIRNYWYNNPFEGYDENQDASRLSNERIMFYIDAVLFATPEDKDNNTWHSTDFWPQEIFSALAHEFQHMINFNIKTIRNDTYRVEIWLNEMMSLCTEDILADKIGVRGPRGVDSDEPGAGLAKNSNGRIPLHNKFPEFRLLYWPPNPEPGDSLEEVKKKQWDLWTAYSNKYAFGAYLMRNNKPATLLNKLMNSKHTDYNAVEHAVPGFESIGQIYVKSAVACIISDLRTSSPQDQGYIFNSGNWVSENFGLANITYNLGSINMYNYNNGPLFYVNSPVGDGDYDAFYPMTNFYFMVGQRLRGNVSRQIKMQSGSMLTVVVKR